MRDDVIDALAPDAPMEKISARNVHAYLAMALSAADGGRLTVDTTEPEKVAFVALFPAV